jgi:hypothetical protein
MENNNNNNDEQEQWLPVPDEPYNKSYAISNFGRIKNLNTNNIKTLTVNKATGYLAVRLDVGKKVKKITYQIHQLVAKMFIGECPINYNVTHLDRNKNNNRVSNLKYISKQESMNKYFNNKTETQTSNKEIIQSAGQNVSQNISQNVEQNINKESKKSKEVFNPDTMKIISEYPNYLVDNKGNIYVKETMTIRLPVPNPNGYNRVLLSDKSKRKNKYVHRLVAETFIPNPDNLPYVNHKDANRKNNSVENLEWCTAQQNMSHDSKLRKTGKKIQAFTTDGKFVKEYESIKEAGRELKIDSTSITKAVSGANRRTTAGGYIWKYVDADNDESDVTSDDSIDDNIIQNKSDDSDDDKQKEVIELKPKKKIKPKKSDKVEESDKSDDQNDDKSDDQHDEPKISNKLIDKVKSTERYRKKKLIN